MKQTIKLTGYVVLLVALSGLAMVCIGGLAAIVTGSYTSVLSYLFR